MIPYFDISKIFQNNTDLVQETVEENQARIERMFRFSTEAQVQTQEPSKTSNSISPTYKISESSYKMSYGNPAKKIELLLNAENIDTDPYRSIRILIGSYWTEEIRNHLMNKDLYTADRELTDLFTRELKQQMEINLKHFNASAVLIRSESYDTDEYEKLMKETLADRERVGLVFDDIGEIFGPKILIDMITANLRESYAFVEEA